MCSTLLKWFSSSYGPVPRTRTYTFTHILQMKLPHETYKKEKCCISPTVAFTMSSASDISTNSSKELNRDFEYLLNSTDDESIKKCLTAVIVKEIRVTLFRKWFKVLLLIAFVLSQFYVIPFLNWNASAIGRIAMIKVLKIWDWRYLYSVECLIERKVDDDHTPVSTDNIVIDCSFCENIGKNRDLPILPSPSPLPTRNSVFLFQRSCVMIGTFHILSSNRITSIEDIPFWSKNINSILWTVIWADTLSE